MKKFLFVVLLIISMLCLCSCGLFEDGYLYIGDVWQDTPENALSIEADSPVNDAETLTIEKLLCKKQIDDILEMTFVSKADTLVSVAFVTNDDGQYCVYGYTEEVRLDSPAMFLLNGDNEQDIVFPYSQHGTTVYGWCYSTVSFTINEIVPNKETYTFKCQGKEWSLDYWWVEDVASDAEVSICYTNK